MKSTEQFQVKVNGKRAAVMSTSKSDKYDEGIDLRLATDMARSSNAADYSVTCKGVDCTVLEVSGDARVVTVVLI